MFTLQYGKLTGAIYIFLIIFLIMIGCDDTIDCDGNNGDDYQNGTDWTIMVYGDGDNNLETFLLYDVQEMKRGYVNNQGLNLIMLADRIDGETSSSDGFGEDFTDTRLYRITQDEAKRISGDSDFPEITKSSYYEADMGDAETLKKFIKFCKANYPADRYALILWNHGDGVRSKGGGNNLDYKGICADDTNGSILYTAEITDVLTENESVDLIGFDACLMGSVEVAYQYRPGDNGFNADVMIASPALEWGKGWDYYNILKRIKKGGGENDETDETVGGNEKYYDPASMTALHLGGIIVEEQRDSTYSQGEQSLACYDLSKVEAVKTSVDTLAVALYDDEEKDNFEDIRDSGSNPDTLHYFNSGVADEWIAWPFFDLYDLCERTSTSPVFDTSIQNDASAIMDAVDEMIIYSFGGSGYTAFEEGKNGVHIFFPDGDREIYDEYLEIDVRHWIYQWWYNALVTNDDYSSGFYYGNMDWCINGATPDNGDVENWFEMLDAWFDYTVSNWPSTLGSFPQGGSNRYNW
ncbi:MAG: clostripain [Spirochaetota bacterium]|nr:clostripain [Spirochaetota bacterium]